jgi:multicomponent Na+:H+ antiporter subunit E
MIAFAITAAVAMGMYLVFTAGSGNIGYWSLSELIATVALGVVTGAATRDFLCRRHDYRMANPLRFLLIPVYIIGPFFLEMMKANLDVAYRVITLKIRPGIIRVKSGMKTDLGAFMLANSITLTPGTITVDIDEESNDLFVHNINLSEGDEKKEFFTGEDLFALANLPAWIRRMAE